MPIQVNEALCQSCGACVEVCPHEAIRLIDHIPMIYDELCTDCGECVRVCPSEALSISVPERLPMALERQPMLEQATEGPPGPFLQKAIPWVSGALIFLGKQVADHLALAIVSRLESRSQGSEPADSRMGFTEPLTAMRRKGSGRQRRRRHGRRFK
jgi:NAD-dependent dihydropyrimidine dehydrogenase PreA subunit